MHEKQPERVGFGGALRNCFTNYAEFLGRSSRSEYWYVQLFFFLVSIPVSLSTLIPSIEFQFFALTVALIASLGMIIPGIALTVRRVRDTAANPYWVFLFLLPFGGLAIAILCVLDAPAHRGGFDISATSDQGSNNVSDKLEELQDLFDRGLIDDEQMKAAKSKALGI